MKTDLDKYLQDVATEVALVLAASKIKFYAIEITAWRNQRETMSSAVALTRVEGATTQTTREVH